MFPFILPLIEAAHRYFQDQPTCGGRSTTPTTHQEEPTLFDEALDTFEDGLNWLRNLGSSVQSGVRRSFRPLTSPIAERLVRERVLPSFQEGSWFLPDPLPFATNDPLELAVDLGIAVFLSPFPPLARLALNPAIRENVNFD
jgi:hypothetical protein